MLKKLFRRLFRFSGFKLGLIITLLFCFIKVLGSDSHQTGVLGFIDKVENTWLDVKFLIRGGPKDVSKFQKEAHVVIAAVDERSMRMEDLGMWPWPRSKTATLIQQLNKCKAKVIGFDVVYSEPDASRLEPVIRKIEELYQHVEHPDETFKTELDKIHEAAQGDRILAKVLEESENVVLGYFFFLTPDEIVKLDKEDIERGKESIGFGTVGYTIKPQGHSWEEMHKSFLQALGVRANLPVLSEAAGTFGFFNQRPDEDRIYRRVPLIISYDKQFYPSLSLQVLSSYYEQPVELLVNTFDGKEYYPQHIELYIGPLGTPTEEHVDIPVEFGAMFRVNFYGGNKTFRHISAGDIIHGDSEACRAVRDKIVLVGVTTVGVYDMRPTPFEHSFPGVEIHASLIENVIRSEFMVRPTGFFGFEILVMFLMGLLFSWLLTRLRLTLGLVILLATMAGIVTADYYLLFLKGVQTHVVMMVFHLAVMFAGIAVYRYATEEREKARIRHTFQFYLSKDVIDEIIKSNKDPGLGGERRELTVMFSDIRGFTTISEKLAPEALAELLNEYLTPMTELVFKHHGTLDKYIGDALMAFFGAPIAFDDHPHAACRAALEMMEELAKLRKGWEQRGLPDIDIGIGVNTGIMSVGNMGSATRFDYTVLGDHVNLGSRLEGLNKNYGTNIIISEFTRKAVGGHFTCRELDAVQVKGKHEPVRIFELLHKGPPDPAKDSWIELFEKALALYKTQKWDEAIAGFEALPTDTVSKMYIGRCQQMKKNPPDANWDGVYKMTTK